MKLYELKRGSRFALKMEVYKEGQSEVVDVVFTLNTLDGMYSHCTTDKGETVHLAAFTEVKEVLDTDVKV